jgi:lysozyme
MARHSSFARVSLVLLIATAGCAGVPDHREEVDEAEQALVVCPDGDIVQGIDVSVWQQDVNWYAVAGDGIKFAFARASYGTSKDTYFDQNWAGMKAAGLVRGAYQYWLPGDDPIAQAQAMLDIMGPLETGVLPPVVDVEQTDGLGPAELTSRLTSWLQHVEAAIGRKPIIYSGKYFWQDNVQTDAFIEYPLWIPNYSLDCPDLPNGYWADWHFFQYTSTGSVSGVAGNVDRNQWNGTLEDLYAFADGGPKYGAEFVSQSFPYASQGAVQLYPGQTIELTLEMKNTGTEPWNDGTLLGTTEPRDRESPFAGPEWPGKNRYARVEGVVLPGETYTFKWKMHAPAEPGLYDEHMSLVQEGVAWFGDPGQGGPPDAQLEGLFEVTKSDVDVGGVAPPEPEPEPDDGVDAAAGCSGGATIGCAAAREGDMSGAAPLFAAALGLMMAVRRRRRG